MHATSTPAALYLRMSKDKTGAGLGIERQEHECREKADRLGLTVVDTYADNDLSAYSGKPRPQYQRLLEDIASGKVRAVVCWHTDRLHRTTRELEQFIDVASDVPTYSVKAGDIDLTTPSGRAMAKTLGAWAQHEVELKSERQKAKNAQVARAGQMPPGGPVPYGFKADRATLDPRQARVIREAYRTILDGVSLGSVLRDLNARQVLAPRGGRWTYSALRNVLLRPLNARLVFHHGAVLPGVQGQWEGLVSEEDFYAMKALLADPSRRTTSGNQRKHLLAGVARCGNCDAPLKSGHVGNRTGKRSYLYRCANPDCTQKVNVARDALEAYVVSLLLAERGSLPVVTLRPQADLGEALARVENALRGQAARLADDDADTDTVLSRLAELKAERASLKSAPQRPSWGLRTVAEEWAQAEDLEARRKVLLGHLGHLSVASRGKTSHRFDPERVTLTWQDFDGVEIPGFDHRLMRRIDEGELPEKGIIGGFVVTQPDGTVIVQSTPLTSRER